MSNMNETEPLLNSSNNFAEDDSDDMQRIIRNDEEVNRIKARNKLLVASLICVTFMVAEIIGGYLSKSLAIMTDAAHMLSDFASFLVSLFALFLAGRPASKKMSFGYHRAEILGALVSVLLIWLVTGILVYEAILRVIEPTQVDGKIMFITACCGLGANIVMAVALGHGHSHGGGGVHESSHGHSHSAANRHGHSHSPEQNHSHSHAHNHSHNSHSHSHSAVQAADIEEGDTNCNKDDENNSSDNSSHVGKRRMSRREKLRKMREAISDQNINVRAAFIHVIGDLVQSTGVMIAAAIIWKYPHWVIVDPICTFVFSILVLATTFGILKEALHVLMEGVPRGVNTHSLLADLENIDGVSHAHDLHIWSITLGKPALAVHLALESEDLDKDFADNILLEAQNIACHKYGIHHSTIQLETHGVDIHCSTSRGGCNTVCG